ncbi:BadF/BadG/BcrA/BcrD ATPase family protein [Streptomyces sp. NPDC052682]|uniref:BadF/BadG/BcrA/BcrD ATPase family protein n=1 Tax=Streptomyces sp. NPDC052682 TaxID=3154954 RepID=UPI003447795B
MHQELVVGVDAGGTRTRAVLAPAEAAREGRGLPWLGEGAAGPGNALTVPVPQLTEHLAEAVGRAVPEPDRSRVVAVAGGFAGGGVSPGGPGRGSALSALTAALRRLGITAGSVTVGSDIEAVFASAPGAPADGLALVAGTGAIATRVTGRRCTAVVDGGGWLLGDDGGGFWLGRAAVRAALRMADGRGPETVLGVRVGRALGVPEEVLPGGPEQPGTGGSPGRAAGTAHAEPAASTAWSRRHREAYRRHVLPAVMGDPPVRLARFAPLVAEAARAGDPVAEALLDEAAGHLADSVRALRPRPGERIVATGGLLGPDGPLTALLTPRLDALGLTLDWVPDGCRGAVALARLAHAARP